MSELRDEYRAALELVDAAKAGGGERPAVAEPAEPASAEVVDLMAMLERSVADAKSARTGAADATVHDLPAPKTITEKAAAKKSSAAPAKKTAAKGKPPRSA